MAPYVTQQQLPALLHRHRQTRLGVFSGYTCHWLSGYRHLLHGYCKARDGMPLSTMSYNYKRKRKKSGLQAGNPHELATSRIDVHDTTAGRIQMRTLAVAMPCFSTVAEADAAAGAAFLSRPRHIWDFGFQGRLHAADGKRRENQGCRVVRNERNEAASSSQVRHPEPRNASS